MRILPPFIHKILLTLTALLICWIGGFVIFLYAIPQQVSDENTITQAIVVLTGGRDRLKTGFQLLGAKRANMLFISGVHREESLKSLFKFLEASRMINSKDRSTFAQMTHLGNATNTEENAQETAEWVKKMDISSLRLVTAAYHMPRSLLELKHLLNHTTIIPHPVFPNKFNQSHWWQNADIFFLAFSEYNKFLYTFVRMHIPGYPG